MTCDKIHSAPERQLGGFKGKTGSKFALVDLYLLFERIKMEDELGKISPACSYFVDVEAIPSISSERVEEIRPLITLLLKLILGLAHRPIIPLALRTLLILPPQLERHEQRAAKQEEHHIRQHHTMTLVESRTLEVNIGRNDTIQISPAYYESQHNTALVDTLGIIGHPGNRVCNARVNPQRAEKGTSILHRRVARADKHTKADDAEQRDDYVAHAARLCAIGNEPNTNRQRRGGGIGRDGEELRFNRRPARDAQVTHDGGQEQTECVERHVAAHVDDHTDPHLPVEPGLPKVLHGEFLVRGGGLLVEFEAANDAGAVIVGEELGFVGEIVDHPERGDADEDGEETFEDEDPGPARVAADAVHFFNGGGEEAAKGAGESGG